MCLDKCYLFLSLFLCLSVCRFVIKSQLIHRARTHAWRVLREAMIYEGIHGEQEEARRRSADPRSQDKGNRTSGQENASLAPPREQRTQEEYQSRAFKARITPRVKEQWLARGCHGLRWAGEGDGRGVTTLRAGG